MPLVRSMKNLIGLIRVKYCKNFGISSIGDINPERSMAGIWNVITPKIACCWVLQIDDIKSPTPTIDNNEIKRPFMKVTYLNKDWPEIGKNRKAEIYYYLIETTKNPDMSKVNYTEHEKQGNFKIESIPLNESIKIIEVNIPKNEKNKVIAPDMIMAITEYLHQCEE